MRYSKIAEDNCSIARPLAVLGDRWTLLVIRQAFLGVKRFEDFQATLGVARNVLAERLQRLVGEDILERRAYQERPPRYEYRLTGKGRDLYPVLVALMNWGDKYTAEREGPPVTLIHRACGHEADPHMVCSHCGETLDPYEMKAVPGPGFNPATPQPQAAASG